MALTAAKGAEIGKVPMEPMRQTIMTLTFDNSYPAGGYDLAPMDALIPGAEILSVVADGAASDGHLGEFDAAANKWKVTKITASLVAEEAGATDLTGVTQKVLVLSR